MYYRHRFLLRLLQGLKGQARNTSFQKLLFLSLCDASGQHYAFVPYKFGCFSFISYADRRRLVREGFLKNSSSWQLTAQGRSFHPALKISDETAIATTVQNFGSMDYEELIAHVYNTFPYFASRSEIAEKHLTLSARRQLATREIAINQNPALFTIGYEGRSLDSYLNLLIKHDIKTLIDVRRNPISMKYGYSKRQLSDYLKRIGIAYKHIPGLGIEGAKRKGLSAPEDYQRLFAEYTESLSDRTESLREVQEIVLSDARVALTCFEKEHTSCHRGCIAEHFEQEAVPFSIVHL